MFKRWRRRSTGESNGTRPPIPWLDIDVSEVDQHPGLIPDILGLGEAQSWIKDRFYGVPAPSNC